MGATMIKEPLKLLLIEDSVDDADLTLRHLHGEGLTVEATRIDTRKQLQEAMATDWDAVLWTRCPEGDSRNLTRSSVPLRVRNHR